MEVQDFTVQDFISFVEKFDVSCWSCHAKPYEVRYYPHEGGLKDKTDGKLYWVYVHCLKCQYDYSFQKILNKSWGLRERPIVVNFIDDTLNLEDKPWAGICCMACWFARGPIVECVCRCGNINHQKGRRQKLPDTGESGTTYDKEMEQREREYQDAKLGPRAFLGGRI